VSSSEKSRIKNKGNDLDVREKPDGNIVLKVVVSLRYKIGLGV